MTDFHRSLAAALARLQQETPMPPYDHNGEEVRAEDVLSHEEMAEYRRQRQLDPPARRSDPVSARAYSWGPTEADREAGREA